MSSLSGDVDIINDALIQIADCELVLVGCVRHRIYLEAGSTATETLLLVFYYVGSCCLVEAVGRGVLPSQRH